MRKRIFVFVVIFIIGAAFVYANSHLRIIVPGENEFSDLPRKEGELVISDGQLLTYHSGEFHSVQEQLEEDLPSFVKINTTTVRIDAGSVIINDRKFENISPITCMYSNSGVGGKDSSTPPVGGTITTGAWTNLFLVPDEADSEGKKFTCILGHLNTGPTDINLPWRMLGTFWSTAVLFSSHYGITKYSGASWIAHFPNNTNAGTSCLPIITSVPDNIIKYKFVIDCVSSSTIAVFTDSSCTQFIYQCATPGIWNPPVTVYTTQLYWSGNSVGSSGILMKGSEQYVSE